MPARRQCPDKGYRFIKSANKCKKSCSKGQYRMKKSPFHCVTPKKSRKKSSRRRRR